MSEKATQDLNIRAVQRLIENFKKDSTKRYSLAYFIARLQKLQGLWSKCEASHPLVCQEMKGDRERTQYTEEFEALENIALDYETLFLEKIKDYEGNSSTATASGNEMEAIKLERIKIPAFDGRYSSWCSFRDLYKCMVHENEKLNAVQKLQYLRSSLRNEAENLIQHLTVTEANYQPAWELLCERYDNDRAISNEMVQRFWDLPRCNKDDVKQLKRMVDITNQLVTTLSTLNVNAFDLVATFILNQKLDEETRKEWQKEIGQSKNVPALQEVLTFLKNRFVMLEALSTSCTKPPVKRPTVAVYSASTSTQCPMCNEDHRLFNCTKFSQTSVQKRRELVNSKRLCFNCLSDQHVAKQCSSKRGCKVCGKKHNTTLHVFAAQSVSPEGTKNSSTCMCTADNRSQVLLATALVRVSANFNTGPQTGEIVTLRALLDNGAQRSLISEAAMRALNANRRQANLAIGGVGEGHEVTTRGQTTIIAHVKGENGKEERLMFHPLISNVITTPLPSVKTARHLPEGLKSEELADPRYHKPSKIDLLIGADMLSEILLPGLKTGNPSAQQTKLGWVLFGPVAQPTDRQRVQVMVSYDELDKSLRRFWELEETPSTMPLTAEEREAEDHYRKFTRRLLNGSYSVRLPFKSNTNLGSDISDTQKAAFVRFRQLEQRFQRDPALHREYNEFMKEYLNLGHMERVPINAIHEKPSYYLPHHAVIKDSSTTTKLRVVFNASQKTKSGKSLNELLLTGPTLQETIFHILMRWRQHRYVITSDIEKMYRQIWLDETDRNCLRILWRFKKTDPIQIYRLTTNTYGTTSAPYLAIKTLQRLAEDERQSLPTAARVLQEDFYVDNCLTGAHKLSDLVLLQKDLQTLLRKGGFHLRQWSANHMKLLENVPIADRATQVTLSIDVSNTINTLGLYWHPATDTFSFKIKTEDEPSTKRDVLSDISKLFDPIGWLQPIIIIGKMAMQRLWKTECSWDEPLDKEAINDWITVRRQLHELSRLRIPRWIGYSPSAKIELHGFCDASLLAFAAAIYIRIINESSITTCLLTAKSKVSPSNIESIPRLELCGAVLLTNIMEQVVAAHRWEQVPVKYWSDSQTVLAWLQKPASTWNIFVANRVSMIQQKSWPSNWNHVASQENPADLATRGLNPAELMDSSLWWNGPSWLREHEITPNKNTVQKSMEVERREVALIATKASNEPEIFSRYSTFNKLNRVIAYCNRFVYNCRTPADKKIGSLLIIELKQAQNMCIMLAQKHAYQEEIQHLKNKKPIPKSSNIRSLTPGLDSEGILRVGGRLHFALVGQNTKHPPIIPKGKLAELLVKKAHQQTMHGGIQLTLATLRLDYWIISCSSLVRKEIHSCLTCFKVTAKPNYQLMGTLPSIRVRPSNPFENTGVDYAGPITIKWNGGRGAKTMKAYVVIFVCMATKAFHLELASDLSADTCIAAIRRFIARRGKCRTLYSDCGTNFVGANRKLQCETEKTIHTSMELLAREGLEWKFIPPGSPHFGGLWEAGVKSMKRHLFKVIGKQLLTIEEFYTLLAQIEACLNSRPLTEISDDPSDNAALTPGHSLTGGNLFEIKSDPAEANLTLLKRWRLVQAMKHSFWFRWSREYLQRLQQRPKWLKPQENPKVGDLVLMKLDHFPSLQWPLARILATHPGEDGLVRVVTLKVNGKVTKRPITKICQLPFSSQTEDSSTDKDPLTTNASTNNITLTKKRKTTAMDTTINTMHNKRGKGEPTLKKGTFSRLLLTTLLTLCTLATPIQGTANVTRLEGGLFIEHIGTASLMRGLLQLNIKIPMSSLDRDGHTLEMVNNGIKNLCTLGNSTTTKIQCKSLASHLNKYTEETIHKIETLKFITNRVKRGLLGQMLTAVFGVNDQVIADVNNLADNQEKLHQLLTHQGRIILQATKILNRTSSRMRMQLSHFSEQLEEGLKRVNQFREDSDHNAVNIQFLGTYHQAMNFVQEVKSKYNRILTALYTRTGIRECIQLAELETDIQRAHALLSPQLDLLHLTTADITVFRNEEYIDIQGHLPIVEKRPFDLIKATSIPQHQSGKTYLEFAISNNILGVNYKDQIYFETSETDVFNAQKISSGKYLLSSSILIDIRTRSNCIIKEIYKEYTMDNCSTHGFTVEGLVLKQLLSRNAWLFVAPELTHAQTICKESRTNIMLNGTGLLQLTEDCSIHMKEFILSAQKTMQNHQFVRYITPSLPVFNLSASPISLKHIQKSIILQPFESFETIATEQEKFLSETKETTWKKVQYHGITAITAILTSCILVLVAVVLLRCKTCRRKQSNENSRHASSTWYEEHQV